MSNTDCTNNTAKTKNKKTRIKRVRKLSLLTLGATIPLAVYQYGWYSNVTLHPSSSHTAFSFTFIFSTQTSQNKSDLVFGLVSLVVSSTIRAHPRAVQLTSRGPLASRARCNSSVYVEISSAGCRGCRVRPRRLQTKLQRCLAKNRLKPFVPRLVLPYLEVEMRAFTGEKVARHEYGRDDMNTDGTLLPDLLCNVNGMDYRVG